MDDPLKQVQLRTLRYWHIDGLTEIAFGLVCLILGLYFTVQGSLSPGSRLYRILDVSLVLVLLVIGLGAGRLVNALKQRITYPRTGYVGYKRSAGKQRWLGAAFAMVIGLAVAGMMASAPASFAWMPAITSLILATVLLLLGYRFSLLRYYLLAGISAAIGIGLSISGLGDVLGLGVYYLLFSLPVAISGAITLWMYLRSTQPPERDSDGD